MALLTIQELTEAGVTPAFVAAAGGGDHFIPADRSVPYLLHVKNGSGGAITVTVNDPTSTSPVGATSFNADLGVSVPATTGDKIIRIPPGRFINVADGHVDITYSGVTSLTVAVYKVPTSLS